jgi:hypothetical protein
MITKEKSPMRILFFRDHGIPGGVAYSAAPFASAEVQNFVRAWAVPTWLKLVPKSAGAGEGFEGPAEVVGDLPPSTVSPES